MRNNLVLDVPPGIGLFGMAFELERYCVVNGPDLLWGKDMRDFHPPAGVFEGIIGGPPCIGESLLAHLNGDPNITLADEWERIIDEAQPDWFVMEAVRPHPEMAGVHIFCLSPRWLGEKQSRKRYFHSNLNLEPLIEVSLFENSEYKYAVRASNRASGYGTIRRRLASYDLPEACELQGVPAEFCDNMPFTKEYKLKVIGNGVPIPVGRAIAKAVRNCTVE